MPRIAFNASPLVPEHSEGHPHRRRLPVLPRRGTSLCRPNEEKLGQRLKEHVGSAIDCPFAWRIAREETNNRKASYIAKGSRKDLLAQPEFRACYDKAKKQIRTMHIRYVAEDDPIKQALLEIYVAVITRARHNDFDTH